MQVIRRRRLDAVLALIGLAVVILTALLARGATYGWESAVFRAINDLPSSLRQILWVLNQYGTAITIPVATVLALLFRSGAWPLRWPSVGPPSTCWPR